MKTKIAQLTSLFSLVILNASGQHYDDYEYPLLVTGGGVSESYVNRTTDNDKTVYFDREYGTYEGKNVNITNNYTDGTGYCFYIPNEGTIRLTADQGTWNNLTSKSSAMFLRETQSLISRTRINLTGNGGTAIHAENTHSKSTVVTLDQVEFNLQGGQAIKVDVDAVVTNKDRGGVKIVAHQEQSSILLDANNGASIDLHKTDINMRKGRLMNVYNAGTVSLTNSSIKADTGNRLIQSYNEINAAANRIILDNVDMSLAKNQQIYAGGGASEVLFANGTNFDGSILSSSKMDLIIDHASWNITENSNLSGSGSLSLTNNSILYFNSTGTQGDFTNINTLAVMLESNTILQLDADSSEFSAGQTVTLFTGVSGQEWDNKGALLVTSDGKVLVYDDLNNGSFTLTGQSYELIPEPGVVSLGLLGLLVFSARRRR